MIKLEFPYSEQQRKLFKSGELISSWAKKYPNYIWNRYPMQHSLSWLNPI